MKKNNIKKIKEFLKKLEVSEKEITVYLYTLSNGPRIIAKIAKDCGLTRTHTYDIVKKMEEKGLCHLIGSDYGKKVSASRTEDINNILESKKQQVENLTEEFKNVSLMLSSLSSFNPLKKTEVSYFKGSKNIEKMILMSSKAISKEVLFAGSELELIESIGLSSVVKYNINRSKNGTKLKSLRSGNKRGSHYVLEEDRKYLREIRVRPKKEIRLKSNIIIWDSYIGFISLKDNQIGTLIEDESLSTMLKTWFEFIWSQSKKI